MSSVISFQSITIGIERMEVNVSLKRKVNAIGVQAIDPMTSNVVEGKAIGRKKNQHIVPVFRYIPLMVYTWQQLALAAPSR